MSIVVMVNEKFRENVPAWEVNIISVWKVSVSVNSFCQAFKAIPDKIPAFFQRVLTACGDDFEVHHAICLFTACVCKLECNVYFRISLSRNRQFCWCSLSAASRVLYVMWAVRVDMAVRYVGNCQEEELIRVQVQRLVSLPMWTCLLPVMSGYDYQAGNLTMLIFRRDLRWSSKLCQGWRNTGVLWRREMLRWMKQQGIGSHAGLQWHSWSTVCSCLLQSW